MKGHVVETYGLFSTRCFLPPAVFVRTLASGIPAGAILQQAGDQGRPASLVTGPESAAGVAVEVLVKENVVSPMRVVRPAFQRAVARSWSALVWHEQRTQPLGEFAGHP
ncbi:MAG: hypothetical protein JWN70_1776, partial [Planctomycetaceae bacterium]|nr:hypothetical protein [Planctomycetaceae bacterium]